MAPPAPLIKPVGSTTWIAIEKENVANLVQQEMEEVQYPVRNELDWLNEHMADIFAKDHQLYVFSSSFIFILLLLLLLLLSSLFNANYPSLPLYSNLTDAFKTPSKLRTTTTGNKTPAIKEPRMVSPSCPSPNCGFN